MTVIDRLTSHLESNWEEFLSKFLVCDLTCPEKTKRSWLICESPHMNEVVCGYPMAGRAGKTVAMALVDCDVREAGPCTSIGKLIKCGTIESLGIINVSQLPLQSGAYTRLMRCQDRWFPKERYSFKDWAEMMIAFETVRQFKETTDEIPSNPLVRHILDDFRDRVCKVRNTGDRVLLCGLVAQACWRLSKFTCEHAKCVPHPSARNKRAWYQDKALVKSVRDRVEWLLCSESAGSDSPRDTNGKLEK